jgi:hypothetical protein
LFTLVLVGWLVVSDLILDRYSECYNADCGAAYPFVIGLWWALSVALVALPGTALFRGIRNLRRKRRSSPPGGGAGQLGEDGQVGVEPHALKTTDAERE